MSTTPRPGIAIIAIVGLIFTDMYKYPIVFLFFCALLLIAIHFPFNTIPDSTSKEDNDEHR